MPMYPATLHLEAGWSVYCILISRVSAITFYGNFPLCIQPNCMHWYPYYLRVPSPSLTPYSSRKAASPTMRNGSGRPGNKKTKQCHRVHCSPPSSISNYQTTYTSRVVKRTTIFWTACWTPWPAWGIAWCPHTTSSRRKPGRSSAGELSQLGRIPAMNGCSVAVWMILNSCTYEFRAW